MTEHPQPTLSEVPPRVPAISDETVEQYTRARLRQHTHDSYAGVPISKFPEDLRVYEHLLWLARADVVIELGAQYGGSALWFRDRLRAFGRYRQTSAMVIAVDREIGPARENIQSVDRGYGVDIKLIQGDVTDPELPRRVAALLPPGRRCFVVEDTAHIYETTLAALRGFSGFVPPGGFLVVEDGCVDVEALRIAEDWPRGVLPALQDWLQTEGSAFTARRDLELYGVTCHPHGFLQRAAAP